MFDPGKINKEVSFKFYGEELKFYLSHGLFSSFDIDMGSKLLLKAMAKGISWDSINTLYDVGCGVGTLGLSLKKRFPHVEAYLQDRDCLAVEFSHENARRNKLDVHVSSGMALIDSPLAQYDLIISNIPAKAGAPVIEDFLLGTGAFLSSKGIVAVVIVNTLAQWSEEVLVKGGCEMLHKDQSKQHTVLIYRPPLLDTYPGSFKNYIRHKDQFDNQKVLYPLETVYNLPSFDTLSYEYRLAGKVLRKENWGGRVLFWNPGQGHMAKFLSQKKGTQINQFILAGRDTLSLKITEHNLREQRVLAHPVADWKSLAAIEEENLFHYGIIHIEPITKTEWVKEFWNFALPLFDINAKILIIGKSADVTSLLKDKKNVQIDFSLKDKGKRVVLLKKNH